MNKIIYISDFFYPEVLGGGELNDHELVFLLQERGFNVTTFKSNNVSVKNLEKNKKSFYIVSNFIMLSQQCKEYLQENCNYVIYEHDHKYLKTRNPALYNEFKAPASEIVNGTFYSLAKKVFCQSSFHKRIIEKNLGLKNIINLSGNLWSLHTLKVLRLLNKSDKTDKTSILDSPIDHKNTTTAESYCKLKNIGYEKIKSNDYHDFLKCLSRNGKFLFIPKTPETLSRIVVEAKMMGIKVITNRNVGASYEDWFHLSGSDLIDKMVEKRSSIIDIIVEEI